MIKTLTNLLKQDKEKFVVPKGVQDCIPITAIYDDGIFRVGKDKYSKSFKFTDINYAVASREDKEAMFLEYSELLNSLDSGATTKLTINNRRLNRLDFEKTILIPETGDDLDVYREEYNKMLLDKAAGNSKRQIKFINDFKTTALHAIPSYAIRLAEVFQEEGLDPKGTTLKTLVIGAEPHTDEQRRKIERMLGVKAYNSFGMTEMNGPGVAFECQEQNGMHFWEDCYLVEIIDPETCEPVPEGEIGELVLTTLDREMMPLIRYRTRDLTRILPGKCPCGRTHIRIDRIKGRSDDMFIIKGVNIFPMQVEKILVRFPELGSNYLITLETVNNQDEMIVEVELSDLSTDNYIELEKIRKDITRQLKDEILVTPKVKLVKKGSLPQSEGKAVRVKDLRDNK